jgi:sugar/nucleoside kinase (ribokinase family)
MKQVEFLIYGKIIIDGIRLHNGEVIRGVLGGGGPQAAFGARLWNDSIGFLSRSGKDIEESYVQSLHDLDLDLTGWIRYPDIATTRALMAYDENEYVLKQEMSPKKLMERRKNWVKLLGQRLPIPEHYQEPRAIHLVTEFHEEPMVEDALRLREKGALLSLEPLIDYKKWSNKDEMLALIKQVDIVSPDWPSASGIAGSSNPKEVMEFWSKLGPKIVAVRHGRHGSYAWDTLNDEMWHIPALPVDIVDPTGAGNSYGGGVCVGWAASQNARTAATYGAISAWFLVARIGLPKMVPSLRKQAEELLDRNLDRARKL